MSASLHPRIVACPTCQTSVPWTAEQRYRPFCSDRCRLIDLGEWVAGEKVITEPIEFDDMTETGLWQALSNRDNA